MFKSLVKDNIYIKGRLVKLNKYVCRAIINNYNIIIYMVFIDSLKKDFWKAEWDKNGVLN